MHSSAYNIPIIADNDYLVRNFNNIASISSSEVVDILYLLYTNALANANVPPKCVIINIAELYRHWLIYIFDMHIKNAQLCTDIPLCKSVSIAQIRQSLMCVSVNLTYNDALLVLNNNSHIRVNIKLSIDFICFYFITIQKHIMRMRLLIFSVFFR